MKLVIKNNIFITQETHYVTNEVVYDVGALRQPQQFLQFI